MGSIGSEMRQPRLSGRVALVTGASSGVGREICFAYASHGTKLIVCADLKPVPQLGVDQDERPTHEIINTTHGAGKAVFIETDVGDSMSMKHAVEEAVRLGDGRLDIMVNNAGLGSPSSSKRLHEEEDEAWDRMIRVNVRGVYLGCKYALAQMVKQDLEPFGRRGWIVNLSSMLGYVAISGGTGAYCASKGASLNLTRQIALDYAKDRIHCNALCPGFTKTAMTRGNWEDEEIDRQMKASTPWGDWGRPEDVAKGAVFLATDDAAWVTGIGLPVDGGYLAQ